MAAPQSTPLPEAPERGESEGQFVPKANAFVGALEPFRQQLQAQADFVNDRSTETEDNAALAQDASEMALSSANFAGYWSGLTGAFNVPTSVLHDDTYWQLLEDVSNIQDAEPGVSAAWAPINVARNVVLALPDITSLSSLNTAALVDGQQFSVGSYLPDTSTGSCLLRWRPDLPKSRHDGVLFFSLTVPMFVGTDTTDYRNGVGETDPGGNGVMELVRGEIIYDATVLIPGYYSTAQSALDDLSGRIRIAQGVEVRLLHESGHQPEIGVSVSKGNYSAYVITSQDATIIVGNGFSGHFVTATDGAHAPTLGALVDGNSLVSRGLNLFNGAQALVLEGCGVVAYTEAGIWCYAGSSCQASNANFSNGSGIAIRASQRSNIVAPGIDVSGNTSSLYTVYINRASSAHLQQINLSQCDAPVALRAHRTAQVHAAYAFSDSCNDFAIASATSTLSIQGAFVTGIRGQAVLAHRASLVTMYDDDTVHGADSARFVAASGNDSVGVRGTDASSIDGRGCKISGFGVDNINLADSCSGQFRGALIEGAGRDGVACNSVSTISVSGGSVTGSTKDDLSVTGGGQIAAQGASTTSSEGTPSIDDCNISSFRAISAGAGIIWN